MNAATQSLIEAGRMVLGFALPIRCPACGAILPDEHRFCLDCWQRLDLLEFGCRQCGEPDIDALEDGDLCAACLADPPPFDSMRAAVRYGEVARTIALRLKYGGRVGLARVIAAAMRRHMTGLDDALIVPVPLHRGRIWRRGFNQSALIAAALAGTDRNRLRVEWLERHRATPYLRGMHAGERAKAVRGVFRVPEPVRAELKGRRIVLVDDVYTSGATSRACAKLMKRHGAAEVHVRCWARVSRLKEDGQAVDWSGRDYAQG